MHRALYEDAASVRSFLLLISTDLVFFHPIGNLLALSYACRAARKDGFENQFSMSLLVGHQPGRFLVFY